MKDAFSQDSGFAVMAQWLEARWGILRKPVALNIAETHIVRDIAGRKSCFDKSFL